MFRFGKSKLLTLAIPCQLHAPMSVVPCPLLQHVAKDATVPLRDNAWEPRGHHEGLKGTCWHKQSIVDVSTSVVWVKITKLKKRNYEYVNLQYELEWFFFEKRYLFGHFARCCTLPHRGSDPWPLGVFHVLFGGPNNRRADYKTVWMLPWNAINWVYPTNDNLASLIS